MQLGYLHPVLLPPFDGSSDLHAVDFGVCQFGVVVLANDGRVRLQHISHFVCLFVCRPFALVYAFGLVASH